MTPDEVKAACDAMYEEFHEKVNDFLMGLVDARAPSGENRRKMAAAMAGKAAVVSGALMLGVAFGYGAEASVDSAQSWLKQFQAGFRSRN